MGEAKNRRENPDAHRAALDKLSRSLADQGRLIEAGWASLRAVWIPADAPAMQIDCMRQAYMAGAQHLFSSIVSILEPGTEATPTDERRLQLIADELDAFYREAKLRAEPPQGSG
jgi:hypothetical protein